VHSTTLPTFRAQDGNTTITRQEGLHFRKQVALRFVAL